MTLLAYVRKRRIELCTKSELSQKEMDELKTLNETIPFRPYRTTPQQLDLLRRMSATLKLLMQCQTPIPDSTRRLYSEIEMTITFNDPHDSR